jgi:uncharacterized protein YjiK
MNKLFSLVLLQLSAIICLGQTKFYYDLDRPDIAHQLPAVLNEISGLTDIDNDHIACVQDELGIVFIYNFRSGEMVSQHRFDSVGDFEGLTYTGKSLYILRSDGRLTEWNDFPTNKSSFIHSRLSLATSNNEGLCYDPGYNRLLIAAKSKPQNHDEKAERFIYGYDLTTKKLMDQPVYRINVHNLAASAKELGIKQEGLDAKGITKPLNFRPASLAVHPVTHELYIISAADQLLVVLNRNGDILHLKTLAMEQFAKAEGITFLRNGTMIITNEAAGKAPNLYVFEMKH